MSTWATYKWPAMVVGLLTAVAIFDLSVLIVAKADPSFAVEEDYYARAASWDEQQRKNAESNWSIDLKVAGEEVSITVLDAAGAVVDGAAVKIRARHNARSAQVQEVAAKGRGRGVYSAPLALNRPGIWLFAVSIEREGLSSRTDLRREISK